jgi:hypothetical protein
MGNGKNTLRVSKFSEEPVIILFDERNSQEQNHIPSQNMIKSLDPTTLAGGDTIMNIMRTDRT